MITPHRSRAAGVLLLALLTGCAQPVRAPVDVTSPEHRITIGKTKKTPEEIQAELMIYLDRYWAVVSQTMDDVRRSTTLPQRRLGAQSLKIVSVESALRIATHANPVVALLDMTVMVTLMRQVWDEHWGPTVYNEPPGGAVALAFASLEAEIWTIARGILSQTEVDALDILIAQMRDAYPDQVYVVNLRASEFAAEQGRAMEEVKGGASLLALFALDPLASLAPATREIQASRLLAERAFFYATRLPGLMSWRADRALLFAAAMPEVAEVRQTADELRSASARIGAFSETLLPELERQRVAAVDQLFARLEAERAGAVSDVFDRIADEREAFIDSLRRNEEEAKEFLGALDGTTAAATLLSDSLRETMAEARQLALVIGEFRSGDDGGRPFDIREYEALSKSTTETVRELTALIGSLNTLLRAPEWSARSKDAAAAIDDASSAGSRLVDRAFSLAFGLVAFTVVSVLLAALCYRAVAQRLARRATLGGAT
jgi:hypothetical protein